MNIYECDREAQFDDTNLPDDVCDHIRDQITLCSSTVVGVWSVGGDEVRFVFDCTKHKMYLNRSWNILKKLATRSVVILLSIII